jgi:hypothetical protein
MIAKCQPVTPPIYESKSNCSISLRGRGSCFDLNESTPSGISAPTQNLLARLPAIASDRGNFRNSFSVPFRASFIFRAFLGCHSLIQVPGYAT